MTTTQTPRQDQRVVRVFISSTFKDVQGDREELVKYFSRSETPVP
jgi:hypothetical protein